MSSPHSIYSYIYVRVHIAGAIMFQAIPASQRAVQRYANKEVECDKIEGWPENNQKKRSKNLNKSAYKLFKIQIY